MRIVTIDGLGGRAVDAFGSQGFTLVPLAKAAHVALVRLEEGGRIGTHPAVVDQLFAVLDGRAQVSGEDGEPREIGAGEAAWWAAGEVHTTTALTAVRALMVEAEDLAPAEKG